MALEPSDIKPSMNGERIAIVSTGTAVKFFGKSRPTLRRYAQAGKIRCWLSKQGTREWRWYAVEDLMQLLLDQVPRLNGK